VDRLELEKNLVYLACFVGGTEIKYMKLDQESDDMCPVGERWRLSVAPLALSSRGVDSGQGAAARRLPDHALLSCAPPSVT